MPTPALLLLLAALLPLVAFGVLLLGGKRAGEPLAGYVGAGVSAASFLCTMGAMADWIWQGRYHAGAWGMNVGPIDMHFHWLPIGPTNIDGATGWLDLGLYVDSLTIAMFAMITLVTLLVHVFSIGYMRGDSRNSRYFAYLGLFSFSMLGLVLGGTILQVFIFWELVGLCSYLLVGFWYERRQATNAAIKAFITNRVGDFAFLVGLGILIYHLGNVSFGHLWATLGNAGLGGAAALPDGSTFNAGLLTFAGLCLFAGAVGKSAQFPLHTWLPDAMEGPTPVSALIHAATMVAAGVYLVARVFPILTPQARLVIAIVGCVTLTLGALAAVAQTDIKRVLAYSTISQLGYMMLAIGVGSWIGGLFHLITHAFFKALLFLGAGSVIHATGHEQEMQEYGGLLKQIPVTAITFAIAVLAISGAPFLSGYFSKEMILTHAGAFASLATSGGGSQWYWALFILPTAAAYLTAFYMARCWMLTFWGEPRNPGLHAQARETGVMYWPLILLAVPAVISGWRVMNVRPLIEGSMTESYRYASRLRHVTPGDFYRNQPLVAFRTAWPGETPINDAAKADPVIDAIVDTPDLSPSQLAHVKGEHLAFRYAFWAPVVGLLLGMAVYRRGYRVASAVVSFRPIGFLRRWLYHGMYVDALYQSVFVAAMLFLASLGGWWEKYVVDGCVDGAAWLVRRLATTVGASDRRVVDVAVDGVGQVVFGVGAAVRNPASGRIRLYVTLLLLALVLGGAGAACALLGR